jgi:hypothetical protein
MDCFYCNYSAEEPKDLASHIQLEHSNKRNKWAAKVLTNVEWLNRKVDKQQDRMPLTEEEREAKRSTHRELSGIEKNIQTYCVSCQSVAVQKLPVEFIRSPYAWRINNKPIVLCNSCRR